MIQPVTRDEIKALVDRPDPATRDEIAALAARSACLDPEQEAVNVVLVALWKAMKTRDTPRLATLARQYSTADVVKMLQGRPSVPVEVN